MKTQPRIRGLAFGLAGLSALVLASGGSVAMAQVSGPSAHQAPALSSAPQAPRMPRAPHRPSAAPASPAGPARAASDHTLSGGWEVQSSAATTDWTSGNGATQGGAAISAPGFATGGWLPVAADDAGAVGTEVEALLQNGVCPDWTRASSRSTRAPTAPAASSTPTTCSSASGAPQTRVGADTNPLFDVPWWFRTDFTAGLAPGQDAKLVVNGVVGQADVWVNGTEVATQATVEGDYTSYTFDVTSLLAPGTNTLALELYPEQPEHDVHAGRRGLEPDPAGQQHRHPVPGPAARLGRAWAISNVYVTQNDAPDMSSAALTVHADVTNNTGSPADRPGRPQRHAAGRRRPPIQVSQTVDPRRRARPAP